MVHVVSSVPNKMPGYKIGPGKSFFELILSSLKKIIHKSSEKEI